MQTRQTAKADYFAALTGLRFVLAVWVILHHLAGRGMILEQWTDALPPAAQNVVRGGYLAVQTFFVLSGFVLARSYTRVFWTLNDLVRYGSARISRIYPVYLLSLAVVSPFIFQAMRKPGSTPLTKAGLLLNYGLVLQGWTGTLGVGWNTPAWSLSCEFFFYLVFPLLFALLRKAAPRTLAAVLAGAVITPVLLAHAGVPWSWKPIHHLSDFAAGIAGARLFEFARPAMARRGVWLYGPALMLGAVLIMYPQLMDGTYGDANTGLRPLNVAALLGLALGGGAAARLLSSRPFEYLGKVSYSMYILHVPILWWYGNWAMHGSWHMPRSVAAAFYLAIVTVAAVLAFEFVEVPMNRRIRGWVTARLEPTEFTIAKAA